VLNFTFIKIYFLFREDKEKASLLVVVVGFRKHKLTAFAKCGFVNPINISMINGAGEY